MTLPDRDYVPQNAAQFNAFMQNLLQYIGRKFQEWGHIPEVSLDNLMEAFRGFERMFQATQGPHTSAQNMARREAQAETTRALRAFVNRYLRSAPVTTVDRMEMGIPNHDTIRSGPKVVTETVDYEIHLCGDRELVVDFWTGGADRQAKPADCEGAVIIWDIRDTSPENPEELMHHTMASHSPFTVHFEENERGKTVYIALAWQNERGIIGQWSEYKSAVIP